MYHYNLSVKLKMIIINLTIFNDFITLFRSRCAKASDFSGCIVSSITNYGNNRLYLSSKVS